MNAAASLVGAVGARFLDIAAETGGMAMILVRSALALFPPRIDWRELLRGLHRFGVQSLPIVTATAFFTGIIVMLQAAVYVEKYGATILVGWGTGFTTLRELGPVLIALMLSGRVGSNNTAELATMTVTEQVDTLRALAIDPYGYLVIPRVFAMVIATVLLTIIGDALAILGGALAGKALLGVELSTFWASFSEHVRLHDFTHGLVKAAAFGLVIGAVSCHFGLSVTGGARGVGAAVNRSVVASAVGIFVLDFVLTYLLR